jgi:NDP-sugar pyrophosphorylase family protein
MNIIIPAAGRGSRFHKTHSVPKPLIPVNGMCMITRAILSLEIKGQYNFIVKRDEFLRQTTDAIYASCIDPNIIVIDETTEGSAVSALMFENKIDADSELIVVNCDQILDWESDIALNHMREYDGAVVSIKSNDPKHSFARVNNDLVEEIVEKKPISDNALTGIHYWKRSGYFFDSARKMIENNDRTNGEFYVGPTYNYLIRDGLGIGIYEVSDKEFYPVGTPEDLERYLNETK